MSLVEEWRETKTADANEEEGWSGRRGDGGR